MVCLPQADEAPEEKGMLWIAGAKLLEQSKRPAWSVLPSLLVSIEGHAYDLAEIARPAHALSLLSIAFRGHEPTSHHQCTLQ